jgi:RNA polymerase sigma-70 factor (ECF subfamily)
MSPHAPIDAEVLLRHGKWLAQLARALVARDDEIDDVVQQTYANALAQPPRHRTNLRAWLGAVARNVVRSRTRSDASRTARELALPPPPAPETPDEALARAELRRRVVEAVLALAEPYRSAVILRFFEEQPVAAVARMTGAPEDTVRTRVRRGVALLRESLEASVGDRSDGGGAATRALLFARLAQLAGHGAPGASLLPRFAFAALLAAVSVTIWVAVPDEPKSAAEALSAAPAPVASTSESGANPATPLASTSRLLETLPATTEAPSDSPHVKAPVSGESRFIHGVVTNWEGAPVSGAVVWWTDADDASDLPLLVKTEFVAAGESQTRSARPHALSSADGSYELPRISKSGDYLIAAYLEGEGCAVGGHRIRVGPAAEPREMPLRLIPMVRLEGTVSDTGGRPLEGAMVTIVGVNDSSGPAIPLDTEVVTTDTAGHWSAACVIGMAFSITPSARRHDFPEKARRVDLPHGRRELGVDFVLADSGEIEVRGPVVDDSGAPFDLAPCLREFFVSRDEDCAPDRRTALIALPGGTRDDFEVGRPFPSVGPRSNLPQGIFDVASSTYEIDLPVEFEGALVAASEGVVVGAVTLGDLRLPPPLPLSSRWFPPVQFATALVSIVDADSGEAVDATDVDLRVDGHSEIHVDGIGVLWLAIPRRPPSPPTRSAIREIDVPLGGVTISAKLRGRTAATPHLEFEQPGERRPVELRLARAESGIRGRVKTFAGTPCENASVDLFRSTQQGVVRAWKTWTGKDGAFEVSDLEEAEYVVVVRCGIVGRVRAASPPAEVELQCIGREHVTLRPVDGRPAFDPSQMEFEILDPEGITIWEGRGGANASGRFECSMYLAPGHYRFVARRNHRRAGTAEFDVVNGAPLDRELELAH